MGKADTVTRQYMNDNTVFADAFNYLLYDGKQVIQPEKLHTLDTTEVSIPYGADGAIMPVQKIRDELKYLTAMTDDQTAYVILGIENQTKIHYAMPVKNMVYDALQYAGQVRKASSSHREAKDSSGHSSDEYLSGFYKDDRLIPVITLVIFFSPETWEGPLCLYDMLNPADNRILSMIDNYRIHLIAPKDLSGTDFQRFSTNLREVLEFIKYSKDKKRLIEVVNHNKRYSEMDKKAAMVIETCTGTDLNIDKNKEVVNVCQAILEMKMEEREIGRSEGLTEGLNEGFTQAIINLMESLQCTAESAMDMLKIPNDSRQQLFERINNKHH